MCDVSISVAFGAVMFHQESFGTMSSSFCLRVMLDGHFSGVLASRFLFFNIMQFSFFLDQEE
jgi:hypothetical protein